MWYALLGASGKWPCLVVSHQWPSWWSPLCPLSWILCIHHRTVAATAGKVQASFFSSDKSSVLHKNKVKSHHHPTQHRCSLTFLYFLPVIAFFAKFGEQLKIRFRERKIVPALQCWLAIGLWRCTCLAHFVAYCNVFQRNNCVMLWNEGAILLHILFLIVIFVQLLCIECIAL